MGNDSKKKKLQSQQHKWLLVTTEGAVEAAEAQSDHAQRHSLPESSPTQQATGEVSLMK